MQSGLSDILRIHVNPSGEIVAISYALAKNGFTSGTMKRVPHQFNTTVFVHHGELGPQYVYHSYFNKTER